MSLGKKRLEEEGAGGAPAEVEVEKDDDERELEKLENNDPEMLRVCTVILEQLDAFKVRRRVRLTRGVFLTRVLASTSLSLANMCVCVHVCLSTRPAENCRTRGAPAANGKLWRSSF